MSLPHRNEIEQKLAAAPDYVTSEQKYTCSAETALPCQQRLLSGQSGRGRLEIYSIYPGISITLIALLSESVNSRRDGPAADIAINYCRYGRASWETRGGRQLYLGAGDFSVHRTSIGSDSIITLPLGYYEGARVCIDINKLNADPPELLKEAGISGDALTEKLFAASDIALFPSCEQTNSIFAALFDLPEHLRPAYFKLKVQELLLYLYWVRCAPAVGGNQYQAEQIATVKAVHDQLMTHMDTRVSIEALSKQYLMNATTLKSLFKSVYGTSIAAHIKEHRMERAALLLRDTEQSIAEIAKAVGYESQSKFSATFKEMFGMLPTLYRKTHVNAKLKATL